MNKALLFIVGFLFIVLGLGLVFKNWAVLAAMVKASAGVLLALIGIVMMFMSGLRK